MLEIMPYRSSDLEGIVDLFLETVHIVNRKDYTETQLHAWAPLDERVRLMANWQKSLQEHISYVAKCDGKLVGFADLSLGGYIERIYVHKDYQKQKVATLLLEKLEGEAYQLGLIHLETDASITAHPFFIRQGFEVRTENVIFRKGVPLHNYTMFKEL